MLSNISDSDLQKLEELGYIKRKPNGEYSAKSITSLAYRPGWHAGDLPFFPQGGMKIAGSNYENVHRYNQVVYECEMSADIDYTSYDDVDGKVVYHDMQKMPTDGSYKFAGHRRMVYQRKFEAGSASHRAGMQYDFGSK